ncbi:hypothetical protein BJ912DRAFT_904714 [Pholiota molesta]|nr:hypothetical protein BJ912DRAFT_904714 [Pholiota molesta]
MTALLDPDVLAAEFQLLASVNRRVNINAVASLTWITYDIIICLDDEIELIWKTRWTIPKVLYIITRYFAPLWLMYEVIIHMTPGNKLSKLSCKSFPAIEAMGPTFLEIIVDMIMILRIRALYREQRSIVFTMLFAWFVSASVGIPITIYCFRLARPVPAPPPFDQIAGCLTLQVDWQKIQISKFPVISFILLNILFLGLTLHKFIGSVRSMHVRINFSSMYTIFVGEGIAYFVGCIVLNALDSAFSSGKPDLFPYVDLSQIWIGAYYSYAGCHLILNLRRFNSSLGTMSSFLDCREFEMRFRTIPATHCDDVYSSSASQTLDGPIYELNSFDIPKAV